MAEKTLRVPSNVEPTFWNRDIGLGAAIGFLVPYIPFTSIIGGIVGGFMGKSRMKKEAEEGKDVSPPTFWNRSIFTGAALGQLAGILIAAAIVVATVFTSIDFSASHEAVMESGRALAHSLQLPLALASYGSLAGGALIGGFVGNARMEREYKEAEAYVAQHGEYRGKTQEAAVSKIIVPERAYTVTPEEAQLLESRLAQGKSSKANDIDAQQQHLMAGGASQSFL